MRLLAKVWAFFWRDVRNVTSYRFAFFSEISGVFFSALTFYFLSRLIPSGTADVHLEQYGGDYFSFVLIGIAFTGYAKVALTSYAHGIRDAQVLGQLEALMSCRSRVLTIALGSSAYPFAWVTFRVITYFFVGGLLLGANVLDTNIVSAVVILALTIAAHSAIGILAAGIVLVFKRSDPFTRLFSTATELLAGVYYPLSVLPFWLRRLSYLFPLTHSLDAMRRAVINGDSVWDLRGPILILIAFTVLMLPVSLLVFRLCVKHAKKVGSLAEY